MHQGVIVFKLSPFLEFLSNSNVKLIFALRASKTLIIVKSLTSLLLFSTLNPQKNIYYTKSWSGGKISEYEYRYEYIFTNDDYQEALDNQ